jgi:hypothetical protein
MMLVIRFMSMNVVTYPAFSKISAARAILGLVGCVAHTILIIQVIFLTIQKSNTASDKWNLCPLFPFSSWIVKWVAAPAMNIAKKTAVIGTSIPTVGTPPKIESSGRNGPLPDFCSVVMPIAGIAPAVAMMMMFAVLSDVGSVGEGVTSAADTDAFSVMDEDESPLAAGCDAAVGMVDTLDIDGFVVLTTRVVGCVVGGSDEDNVAAGDNVGTDCTDIVAVIVTVCCPTRLVEDDAAEANTDGFAPISRYFQTAIM